MESRENGITFTCLSSLFRSIAQIQPATVKNGPRKAKTAPSTPFSTFKRWVEYVRREFGPLSPGTTAALFRLIFPEEDTKRKYDMQEPRVITTLARCYGLSPERFTQWNDLVGSGCLGDEVRMVLAQSSSNEDKHIGKLSVLQVDALLTELAALSPFSDASIRNRHPKERRRTRIQIFQELYRGMTPEDAGYITQIILKDLEPVLYPLTELHTTGALLNFNTRAVHMLTKADAMYIWDASHAMSNAYRVCADLDYASLVFEMPKHTRPVFEPTVGAILAVPKSRKGQSCKNSLDPFRSSKRVWAETKYDGERAQIHVTIPPDGGRPYIQIFSKSKRDSTHDRYAVHEIIREALGFKNGSGHGRIKKSVILDAEMVAFDGEKVDEFWRIRRLIENTAHGVRGRRFGKRLPVEDEERSQVSLMSDDSETRILGLVFFDVLVLESKSLLSAPYADRRRALENLIQTTPGQAILAERFEIDMTSMKPEHTLARIFAEHVADFQEGLVLKAEESRYNDYGLPWVKFKKDFIPGYGDTVDMILVGASWEKERARKLRVGPHTLTTFYFGALKDKMTHGKKKPHIEVIFTASYGLIRSQLEDLNAMIRGSDSIEVSPRKAATPRNYTFGIFSGLSSPSVVLEDPLLVELYGAGFSKAPQAQYYELRWPRMNKVYRRKERGWKDGLDLSALKEIAYASVGREKSDKEITDAVLRDCWGLKVSPGIHCPKRRQKVAKQWEEKLLALDRGDREGSAKRVRVEDEEDVEEGVGLGRGKGVTERRAVVKRQRLVAEDVVAGEGASKEDSVRTDAPLSVITNTTPSTPPRPSSSKARQAPFSQGKDENSPIVASNTLTPKRPREDSRDPRQLLTPSTSPIRQKATRESIFEAVLNDAYAATLRANTATACEHCSGLRRRISRDRRIHSIDSLLSVCGWSDVPTPSLWVERGAILVESHDPVVKERLEELLVLLKSRQGGKQVRKPLSVVTCEGQIYQFA